MKRKYVSLRIEIRQVSQTDIVCGSPLADVSDPYDKNLYNLDEWFKF